MGEIRARVESAAMHQSLSLADFTALVERYRQPLFAFLRGLSVEAEQARDILQDTFAEAWQATLQGKAPFAMACGDADRRRWLYRVAYNRAISSHRRRQSILWESLSESHEALDALQVIPQFENDIAEREMLDCALAALSPQDATCLLLIIVHRFTAAEVAEMIGGNAQAISQRFSRAKRRLFAAYQHGASASAEEKSR